MKKKKVIIFIGLACIMLFLAIIIMYQNKKNANNNIEIIDATYNCNSMLEEFYSDSNYIYYFPCVKSSSVYVKYDNGNKELVKTALENNNVTIDELIKAGLVVHKEER